jgi:hypothetical protein
VKSSEPEFLVEEKQPPWKTWWQALAVVLSAGPGPVRVLGGAQTVFTEFRYSAKPRSGRAQLASFLLHVCVLSLILQLHAIPGFEWFQQELPSEIVYEIKSVDLSSYLPNLRAPGPGGRPGRGTRPDLPPKLGSTAYHPKVTVVSNPARVDNFRQTIIQPSSPPELKIKAELKLPNVIIPVTVAAPQNPVEYRLDAKARSSRTRSRTLTQAPDIAAKPRDLAIAPSPVLNPVPRLAVPPAPPPSAAGMAGAGGKAVVGFGTREYSGMPGGLFILSLEPGPLTGSVSLPPGNRYGAFSISPAGGQPGSPGGVPGGHLQGGTGGPGTGGDGSLGVGPGGTGGGGPGISTTAGIGISGGSDTGVGIGGYDLGGAAGPLPHSVVASMIRPVDNDLIPLRKNSLTVTTGPIGGGGLRVYGVLQGGKVYTIYLAMPGKSWILQYCQASTQPARRPRQRRGVVARLTYGLAPPMVDERYDFERPPLPPEKEDEMILLRGFIGEDGSVDGVHVHQGVEPAADQLALAAFRQWRFRPVLRKNEPVKVEFLVGIPAYIEGQTADGALDRAGSR